MLSFCHSKATKNLSSLSISTSSSNYHQPLNKNYQTPSEKQNFQIFKTMNPNVLVIPFPAQGHVNSLLNFSHKLAKHGFKIFFVNTDFNHKRVMSSMAEQESLIMGSQIRFVSIPDGLGPDDDRNDLRQSCSAILGTMPAMLEKLIEELDFGSGDSDGGGISCIVADVSMGWALEVARKLGIKGAALCTFSAAAFAMQYYIPKLIHDGIIDSNGFPIEKTTFKLSPTMPPMEINHLCWTTIGDSDTQKSIFDYCKRLIEIPNLTEWLFCNTTYELEPGTLSFMPKLQPIGPLLESHHPTKRSIGQFWEEDLSCLSWLDQQQPCSVIYLAFGSFTVFDPNQFKEVALGLELTKRPFLWVVREDTTFNTKNRYPDEFGESLGKIVKWAPQRDVLSHPAIACFVSHCGWNSIIDGLCNGVPFLCWPYFGDQIFNESYVCGEWKVGLRFEIDENGLVSSGEIMKKVDQLLGNRDIRSRSSKLKEMVTNNVGEGGQSTEKFNKFVKWLKE